MIDIGQLVDDIAIKEVIPIQSFREYVCENIHTELIKMAKSFKS